MLEDYRQRRTKEISRLAQPLTAADYNGENQTCEWGNNSMKIDDLNLHKSTHDRPDQSCSAGYNKWRRYWSNAEQERKLTNWDIENKKFTLPFKESTQPIFTPTDIKNQCCSNSIEVGSGGSVVKNVLQSCNQVIMSAQEQDAAEAKKKQDEEAKKKQDEEAEIVAAKKKEEEDEEAAIVAAAKKKKMITIIAIIVGVLVFLGLGFAAYKMFFDSESGDAVAETPSANGAETPVSI